MMKRKLLLVGAGGHARSCIDVIEQEDSFQIAGLVGLDSQIGLELHGYKVIATDETFADLIDEVPCVLVTVGQIVSPETRIKLYERALGAGFELVKVISPYAYVSQSSKIGKGTIVMPGAIIGAEVSIGDNCIINSKSLLEHETKVFDHCHISTGAILNGGVTIERDCFIGSGAIIKEGVNVGERSIVGMGVIVRENLEANSNYLGENRK
jgi:sugar O-acyltransferase (sialic acid O-acetyltransferase NeuD family)